MPYSFRCCLVKCVCCFVKVGGRSTDLQVCNGIICSSRLQSSAVLIWNTVDADLTRKQDGHGSHCSYISSNK